MANIWERLKERALAFWNKFNWIQRIIIGGTALAVLVIFFLLTRLALQPDYQPLWETKLDPGEAASITAKLDELKIPYKLEGGGSMVLVPAAERDKVRLTVASEGLPTGGVIGFESLEKTRFGETESDRRARFLVMLQGELTRTIENIPEVEQARVHIVLPEPSLFTEQEKDATAAIWLKLQPGKTLKSSQVQGINQMVASSVEGLKRENISILDTHGNVLAVEIAPSGDGSGSQLSASQTETKREFEKGKEQSISSMLDKILGKPGKAVVRVSADLDFDYVEKKTEDWGEKVKRSEELLEETSTGSPAQPAQGTTGNIPGYPAGTGSSSSSKTQTINNYEIDKVEERRIVAQGAVKKLSVAVVIDGEIDNKKQTTITDAVKNAAGINEERGDTVSVAAVPFDTKYTEELEKEMSSAKTWDMIITYGGAALIALALFIVGRKLLKSIKREERIFNRANVTVEELIETKEREMSPEEKERVRVKQQVEQVAKQNPADAAQLLKGWLAEE